MVIETTLLTTAETHMDARGAILNSMHLADGVVGKYLEDLTDTDLFVRSAPGMNHIAWQLGHLICSEHRLIEAIAPGSMPKLPDGFLEKYSKDNAKLDDPKAFHTKAEYLRLLAEQRAGTKAVLAKTAPEDFDKPGPEAFRRMCKTVGDIFNIAANHPLMHAGQWVVVRRMRGKPVVI
jgi:hypothetical protein